MTEMIVTINLPHCVRYDMALNFLTHFRSAIENLKPGYWMSLQANHRTHWLGGMVEGQPRRYPLPGQYASQDCQCTECFEARAEAGMKRSPTADAYSLFNAKDPS